ncbi:hypothetical protein RIVM261_082140 [Rivularia sp. IAM M-261]|nr:hypothetical protein RIVM261_082140 [Rivularia sp. IAM M-261]
MYYINTTLGLKKGTNVCSPSSQSKCSTTANYGKLTAIGRLSNRFYSLLNNLIVDAKVVKAYGTNL